MIPSNRELELSEKRYFIYAVKIAESIRSSDLKKVKKSSIDTSKQSILVQVTLLSRRSKKKLGEQNYEERVQIDLKQIWKRLDQRIERDLKTRKKI